MNEDTTPGADEAAGADDFARAAEALMANSVEPSNPPDDEDDTPNEAPSEDSNDAEDSPPDQADAEDGEEDAADPEEAEDDAEAEGEEPEDEAPTAVSDEAVVKVGDDELTVAELRNGYLRDADYTRKAQEAASVRKQSEQVLEELQEFRERTTQRLHLADAVLKMATPQPPDESLRNSDPLQYAIGLGEFHQAQQQYNYALAEISQGIEETSIVGQAHTQIADKKEVQERQAKLHKVVPELADPKTRDSVLRDVATAVEAVGLSVDEVNSWQDPRLAHLAVLASRHLKAAKKAPVAKKKLADAPKISKPTTRTSKKSIQRENYSQAQKRLNRVGTFDAAVELLHAQRGLN